ncbi:MAG: hypothetical protein KDN18_08610 [Verrucomicrobiae bacterium]|nr:hypothetical protein [Verrucomicrobiae bacterium]
MWLEGPSRFNFEKCRDIKNHFLDLERKVALLGGVNTLGLTLRERLCSRLFFYILVFSGMWALNRALPDPLAQERAEEIALGVARPYIAVPYADVERELFRMSR